MTAGHNGDTTLVTLTASGRSPVHWSARSGAPWLYLSRSSGTLEPGESFTIKVYVDHLREPVGPWHASVSVAPAGAVVTIDGYGTAGPPAPRPTPSHWTPPAPDPSATSPDPTPSDPPPTAEPTPTPTDPTPSDPPGSTPPSTDGGAPDPSS
ncbi:hypothetical protein SAV31267_045010 [Streptomyces avermitilis]|uniref:BACON domain-containing protein n=1 Tax=Streptomyces avermitilis TaxID=33903 RepID=A0A4D4MTJ4_STRAX|nr:hypothetical protein SAV31267_045010 [Streptomyces avermitilis]